MTTRDPDGVRSQPVQAPGMISDEAVEAAVDALVMTRMGDYHIELPEFRRAALAALEAAAPYMLGDAYMAGQAYGFDLARGVVDPTPNPYRSRNNGTHSDD